jgi:hypothetical protein
MLSGTEEVNQLQRELSPGLRTLGFTKVVQWLESPEGEKWSRHTHYLSLWHGGNTSPVIASVKEDFMGDPAMLRNVNQWGSAWWPNWRGTQDVTFNNDVVRVMRPGEGSSYGPEYTNKPFTVK